MQPVVRRVITAFGQSCRARVHPDEGRGSAYLQRARVGGRAGVLVFRHRAATGRRGHTIRYRRPAGSMDRSDAKTAAMAPAFGGRPCRRYGNSVGSRSPNRVSTPASARTRRWTVNGDFVALQPTGVPRYAREVTLALDALVAEGHPLARNLDIDLVAPRQPAESLPLGLFRPRRPGIQQAAAAAVLGPGPTAVACSRRTAELLQPRPCRREAADRLHPRHAHQADARELRPRLPVGAPV